MNSALYALTSIMKQVTSTTGKPSNQPSVMPKDHSSTRKSKKLRQPTRDHGTS